MEIVSAQCFQSTPWSNLPNLFGIFLSFLMHFFKFLRHFGQFFCIMNKKPIQHQVIWFKIKNSWNLSLCHTNDLAELYNFYRIIFLSSNNDILINHLYWWCVWPTFFKYAPITSVDVDRSFSVYKNLLADNCRSFKFQNIEEDYSIIQM